MKLTGVIAKPLRASPGPSVASQKPVLHASLAHKVTQHRHRNGWMLNHESFQFQRIDLGGSPTLCGTRLVVGARLVFTDGTPDIVAYPATRRGWGRLTRLLTVGNLRAEKGGCILGLGDLIRHLTDLLLIVLPGTGARARSSARCTSACARSSARRTSAGVRTSAAGAATPFAGGRGAD